MTLDELKRVLTKPTADVKQTAAAIGFSEKWTRLAIRKGDIPSVKLGPRKIRVPTTWIAEKTGLAEAA